MRTLILGIAFTVSAASWVQCQTIIPRVGLTIASTSSDEIANQQQASNLTSQTGYTFGVGYNVTVTTLGKGLVSLQPEFSYIQKGYKGKTSGEYNIGEAYYQYTGSNEINVNYIEIPVLAKFEIGSDKIKVAAFAGPSIGFALGGKFKSTFRVDTGEEIQENTSEGDIVFYRPDSNSGNTEFDHNIDFGLQGGASVTFLNHLSLDVRYGMGLTNVDHGNESKNRTVQFTIGVPIKLK